MDFIKVTFIIIELWSNPNGTCRVLSINLSGYTYGTCLLSHLLLPVWGVPCCNVKKTWHLHHWGQCKGRKGLRERSLAQCRTQCRKRREAGNHGYLAQVEEREWRHLLVETQNDGEWVGICFGACVASELFQACSSVSTRLKVWTIILSWPFLMAFVCRWYGLLDAVRTNQWWKMLWLGLPAVNCDHFLK